MESLACKMLFWDKLSSHNEYQYFPDVLNLFILCDELRRSDRCFLTEEGKYIIFIEFLKAYSVG